MGWFSKLVAHTLSYKDSNSRVKVDQGSTGFYLGREFRAYHKLADVDDAAAVVYRVISPVDFILLKQSLDLTSGAREVKAYIAGGTPGGTWTPIPIFGRNRMSGRPNYLQTGAPYVGQLQLATGGTFNVAGATEADLLMVRAATSNTNSTNVGGGGEDFRGLPAGTYYIVCGPGTGTPANTDNVNGKYEIVWEERPNGNQA